jgi:hypothetical protein
LSWATSDAHRLLIRDAGPLEGLRPLTEREIFDNLAIAKQEPIGKSSASPFGRPSAFVLLCNEAYGLETGTVSGTASLLDLEP